MVCIDLYLPYFQANKKKTHFISVNHKKRLSSENLFLYYRPNEMGKNRLGFVVPKRIEKLAVKRNDMRRSLREMFKSIFKSNLHYSFANFKFQKSFLI